MCDPSIAKLEVREIAMPYVTYIRHCEVLHELMKTYDYTEFHKQFMHEVFSIHARFPDNYYNYSADSAYAIMPSTIEKYDAHLHLFNPLVAPGNYKDDCWAILTIGKAEMITPWTGERYDEYFTLAMRSAIGLMTHPSDTVHECFPFHNAHRFELTPDGPSRGVDARIITYKKCKRVVEHLTKSGVQFSTSWCPKIMEDTSSRDQYSLEAPYYASVIVNDANVLKKFQGI